MLSMNPSTILEVAALLYVLEQSNVVEVSFFTKTVSDTRLTFSYQRLPAHSLSQGIQANQWLEHRAAGVPGEFPRRKPSIGASSKCLAPYSFRHHLHGASGFPY